MRSPRALFALFLLVNSALADAPNLNQNLIIACHRVDVRGVVDALRAGADPNASFGRGDAKVFQDKWDLGYPMAASNWTPLIALAGSSPYPNPPREIKSTIADLNWAREQKARIPKEQIATRVRDQQTILLI